MVSVFVLTHDIPYEGSTVCGVFDSKKNAINGFASLLNKDQRIDSDDIMNCIKLFVDGHVSVKINRCYYAIEEYIMNTLE